MKTESGPMPPITDPASSIIAADDPSYLGARDLSDDSESAIRAVILEFGWGGSTCDEITRMFQDPYYPLLNRIWQDMGEAGVRDLVASTLRCSGHLRMQSSVPRG